MKKIVGWLNDVFLGLLLLVFYFVFMGVSHLIWLVFRKRKGNESFWVEEEVGEDELCMY